MNFTGLDAWLIVRQLLDLHIARQTIATQAARIAELEAQLAEKDVART